MNGIDAVALACGQDWRAIEANIWGWNQSCSESKSNKTKPFSSYYIKKTENGSFLCGTLTLPITVGTKGGVINTNKDYSYSLALMNFPNVHQLAQIMVSVGLSQNFAALRALVTDGIQKGHMALHAQNIAIAGKNCCF